MKQLLTSQELIDHMKAKGITFNIDTGSDPQEFLEQHNYYMKLAAYRQNYRKYADGPRKGQYINLDFAYLQELSTIDMHLRYLIIQMCLDIEHFLKVRLLYEIEQNPLEDGYRIIQKFIARDERFKILRDIHSHKSNYCRELIDKYYPYFPAWVFVELISFGELAYLCNFYSAEYKTSIGDQILLNSVRDIRNACAHSNCLINNLKPGKDKPHNSVVDRVKTIPGISEASRDKKLKNKCIYDFVCLLFAYNEIISSTETKQKRYAELKSFFEGRMVKHGDWFEKNNLITSSYDFVKKVIDSFGG